MTDVRETASATPATSATAAETNDPAASVLAIDIGGTKLAAALVRPDGRLGPLATRPTPKGDAEEVFAALAAVATEAVGGEEVSGAGIGSAGPLDAIAGTVSPVNIPGWRGFPVRDRLAALLDGRPVALVNDAVAGAMGEYHHGAGRGVRAMLGMVVSTGVGGGLILDGRVYAGATGNAGHIGHTVVDLGGDPCPCGARGCVETITSGPAMVRWALANGWSGADTTGVALAASARDGDGVALAAFDRSARALAAGISSAAALCDLDRVVIGGGVARAWDLLEPPLRAAMADYAGLAFVRRVEIVRSALDGQAGLLGVAALVHPETA
ncbi:ROK family protein [Actinoallomurus oryzae]|uniref:ROK family protein n=1 Tax=Actinoallomurus oryzae TaxID=502180 RepID=A0ABP8QUJ3_9ACTN